MKNTILYLECASGISGDMTVAALLDLGANREVLIHALNSLPLDGYSIEIKEVFKSGIRACDFHVILDSSHENHDHDMNYLHGSHSHPQNPDGIACVHDHVHPHPQNPDGIACDHAHPHVQSLSKIEHVHDSRNLDDIIKIIQSGNLTAGAQELAIEIFRILAKAEASVHGKPIEEVHFHEVGAVDSIVDIVAVAVCIDNLAPDQTVVSPLTDGCGQIYCQHGWIPVPVPAVAAIAAREKLTLRSTDIQGELVTPTGAAIAAALSKGNSLPLEYQIRKIGYGAGKRNYASTGLLRAMLIEPASHDTADTILTLETNIDDCSGEALSYTMQRLLEAGALDVFYIPIYMKKSRPACMLKVICHKEDQTVMESIIFRNTTTIGIRSQEMHRTKLERRIFALETPWGMADIKCCTHGSDTYYYPESDSVCRLASSEEIGFPEMYHLLQSYAQNREEGR